MFTGRPRIIGVDHEARLLFAVGREHKRFTAHALSNGWRILYLSSKPVLTAFYSGSQVYGSGGRGTLGYLSSSGFYAVTASHIIGEPWASLAGKHVTIRYMNRTVKGKVVHSTVLEKYGVRNRITDSIRHARGEYDLTGSNRADAALIKLEDKIPSNGSGVDVGMIIAGSVPDRLSVVVPTRNIVEALGLDASQFNLHMIEPEIGSRVYKVGSSTGLTRGEVLSRRTKIIVDYGGAEALLTDTIIIRGRGKPFSIPGDSGSVVLLEAGGVA